MRVSHRPCAFLWGDNYDNKLVAHYSPDSAVAYSRDREGSEQVAGLSGTRDAWLTGTDFVFEAEYRWLLASDTTSPTATGWTGPTGWDAMLRWARDMNPLRFFPVADLAGPSNDFDYVECYLDDVEVVPDLEQDHTDVVRLRLVSPTDDFGPLVSGDLFNLGPGSDLSGFTFSRASTATYRGSDGRLKTAASGQLRVEWYDLDGDGIFETPGILLEGSRTNLSLRSEEFDSSTWVKNTVVIEANSTVAPDGATTADTIDFSTVESGRFLHQIYAIADPENRTFVLSFWAKAGTSSLNTLRVLIRRGDGSDSTNYLGPSSWTAIGPTVSGWQRYWVSKTFSSSTTGDDVAFGFVNNLDNMGTVFLWGAQLEEAVFPSSYIKTEGTSVARNADILDLTFPGSPQDITVHANLIRPVWMNISGDLGLFPDLVNLSTGVNGQVRLYTSQTTRFWVADIRNQGSQASSASKSIVDGARISATAQYRNLRTLPEVRVEGGDGVFSPWDSGTPAFTSFEDQIIRTLDIFASMTALKIRRGLHERNQMIRS